MWASNTLASYKTSEGQNRMLKSPSKHGLQNQGRLTCSYGLLTMAKLNKTVNGPQGHWQGTKP